MLSLLSSRHVVIIALAIAQIVGFGRTQAQEKSPDTAVDESGAQAEVRPTKPPAPPTPAKVEVAPSASDPAIADRLARILRATEWFDEPAVVVDEGVVFIRGRTGRPEYRDWATNLATKT